MKAYSFVKHIIIAIVVFTALGAGVIFGLDLITHHGKEISVPSFSALSVAEAQALAQAVGVRVEVADSVYIKRMAGGLVCRQMPEAGSKVKKGRRILLTINAVNARTTEMPNLVGYSLRQARAELLAKGLEIGRLTYISDIATNNVIRQMLRGHEIAPGSSIPSGERIELVLGLNASDCTTSIPDLTGLSLSSATSRLHSSSLNIGHLRFDREITSYADSISAFVWRQAPAASTLGSTVRMGTEVDLYFTLDSSKLPSSTSEQ